MIKRSVSSPRPSQTHQLTSRLDSCVRRSVEGINDSSTSISIPSSVALLQILRFVFRASIRHSSLHRHSFPLPRKPPPQTSNNLRALHTMNIPSMLIPDEGFDHAALGRAKWSLEDDAKLIQLRQEGRTWDEVSHHFYNRSATSCRLHYQNYVEKKPIWNEDSKDKLARVYERLVSENEGCADECALTDLVLFVHARRCKKEMWSPIAVEMGVPWRTVEAMHWVLGVKELYTRAGLEPPDRGAMSESASTPAPPTHPRSALDPFPVERTLPHHPAPTPALALAPPPPSGTYHHLPPPHYPGTLPLPQPPQALPPPPSFQRRDSMHLPLGSGSISNASQILPSVDEMMSSMERSNMSSQPREQQRGPGPRPPREREPRKSLQRPELQQLRIRREQREQREREAREQREQRGSRDPRDPRESREPRRPPR